MNRILLISLVALSISAGPFGWAKDRDQSGVATDVVTLKGSDVGESSGLAVSNRHRNRWWTHNDSGGKPQLFAFDESGKRTGKCSLKGVKAKDWEDMAVFSIDGHHRVVVADCGDNLSKRESISLYLFDEPNPNKSKEIDEFQEIKVTYSDGPRNCEAVAVDANNRRIVMLEKSMLPLAGVYTIALPESADREKKIKATARRLTTLALPMATAMDIDPVNGDVWVTNYFQAFRFRRHSNEQTLQSLFASTPDGQDLPKWRQIEAVAVDRNHQIWVTSEGTSPPLGRLKQSD